MNDIAYIIIKNANGVTFVDSIEELEVFADICGVTLEKDHEDEVALIAWKGEGVTATAVSYGEVAFLCKETWGEPCSAQRLKVLMSFRWDLNMPLEKCARIVSVWRKG